MGKINKGATFLRIDSPASIVAGRDISALVEVNLANNKGAIMATAILLIIENVVTRDTLPPSIPVTTGAAEAVGHRKHIIMPCATTSLNGAIIKYEIKAPPI